MHDLLKSVHLCNKRVIKNVVMLSKGQGGCHNYGRDYPQHITDTLEDLSLPAHGNFLFFFLDAKNAINVGHMSQISLFHFIMLK